MQKVLLILCVLAPLTVALRAQNTKKLPSVSPLARWSDSLPTQMQLQAQSPFGQPLPGSAQRLPRSGQPWVKLLPYPNGAWVKVLPSPKDAWVKLLPYSRDAWVKILPYPQNPWVKPFPYTDRSSVVPK